MSELMNDAQDQVIGRTALLVRKLQEASGSLAFFFSLLKSLLRILKDSLNSYPKRREYKGSVTVPHTVSLAFQKDSSF